MEAAVRLRKVIGKATALLRALDGREVVFPRAAATAVGNVTRALTMVSVNILCYVVFLCFPIHTICRVLSVICLV